MRWVERHEPRYGRAGRASWPSVSSSISCTHTTGSWPTRPSEVARASGLPWLVTVHATEYGRHQGWVQKHPQSQIHAAERRMARRADHVITCSDYMAGHVAQIFEVPAERDHGDPQRHRRRRPGRRAGAELEQLRARYAEAG